MILYLARLGRYRLQFYRRRRWKYLRRFSFKYISHTLRYFYQIKIEHVIKKLKGRGWKNVGAHAGPTMNAYSIGSNRSNFICK